MLRTRESDRNSKIARAKREFEELADIPYDNAAYPHPKSVPQHLLEFVARIKFQQTLKGLDHVRMRAPVVPETDGIHMPLLAEQNVGKWEEMECLEAEMELWKLHGYYSR